MPFLNNTMYLDLGLSLSNCYKENVLNELNINLKILRIEVSHYVFFTLRTFEKPPELVCVLIGVDRCKPTWFGSTPVIAYIMMNQTPSEAICITENSIV